MATLSTLLDLSRNTLRADQAALSVTSDNVANQHTAGYVRQAVNWDAGDTVTLSNGAGSVSSPRAVSSAQRNRILEQRVQQAVQLQSGTTAQAGVAAQIEAVFSLSAGNGSAGSTTLGTALNGFFSSLSALESDPAGAARQGVLNAAATLAAAFNAGSAQLAGVATDLGGQLSASAASINGLTAQVADLNKQIGSISPGGDAGSLENQRQYAIAQLSQLVGLDQIRTENNGITLTTTGGSTLVAGDRATQITAVNTGGTIEIRDNTGTNIGGTISGGSLGGLLAAQTHDLPAARSALDALAFQVASAVNAQNAAGVDATGAAGGAIFNLTQSATGAAASISISVTSPDAIASRAPGEGVTGNGNASALTQLVNATDLSGLTPNGRLSALLSQVGARSAGLQQQVTAQTSTVTQLTSERDALSAVSLDEEAANLAQYQRSYQAAAKLFSVVDSITAAAINLGSPTTVS